MVKKATILMLILLCLMLILLCLPLIGCDDDDDGQPPAGTKNSVILFSRGEAKTSSVKKIGQYCWVDWYKGIEKVLLKSDGTAADPPFKYRWERNVPGPSDKAADLEWFKANCAEPPFVPAP